MCGLFWDKSWTQSFFSPSLLLPLLRRAWRWVCSTCGTGSVDMRAAISVTDDMIDREAIAHGFSGAARNPAVRAALRAAVRARLDPNPRAADGIRRPLPEPRNTRVDAKRLAANDLD
jgi:hypothetical protein